MERFGNDFQTQLSAPIADSVTTSISVAVGVGAPSPNFRIRVDNEYMLVTSTGSGTNWTVQRGIEGSTAVMHTAGCVVTHVLTAAGLAQALAEAAAADGALLAANNLSDLQSASSARSALGLGSAALLASTALLLVANNLSDVTSPSTAAANLGLGSSSAVAHQNLLVAGGTITASAPGLTVTQTWNNAAVPFTASLVNITDTQSASASLLLDLQVASTSKFNVRKDGQVSFAGQSLGPDGTTATPTYSFASTPGAGMYFASSALRFAVGGVISLFISGGGVTTGVALILGATNSVTLLNDAANVLGVRNGTNAQTQRWYAAFGSAADYTRASLAATLTAVTLAAESGTGANSSANVNLVLTPKGTGLVQFGTNTVKGAEAFASYITINDSGGTARKVMVCA